MLCELHVVNLVIVANARLELGGGLTAITGETGAGKSLLLDALHLLLGGRGSAQLVGPAGDHCSISGVFQVAPELARRVGELVGIECEDDQLIIRRRIGRQGRSQAWLCEEPITIGALRRVGALLVDIRVQHEHLRLADVGRQLALLDRYGGLVEEAAAYAQVHARCGELNEELHRLQEGDSNSLKELDYLRFLVSEIDDLDPREGELDELNRRQRLLAGAQEWQELAAEAATVLGEDDQAVVPLLGRFARRLAEAPDADLQAAGAACQQAVDLVQEAVFGCTRAVDRLQADPAELQRVDERLARYHDLLRKHGGSESTLFEHWQRFAERIAWLDNLDERRARLAEEAAAAAAERVRLGESLADQRRSVFARLAKQVHAELAALGMPEARLTLAEETGPAPTALGSRRQSFHISTNPGLPAGPLSEVASGGEAARMTLALAVVLADQDDMPVLVFDEIDAGVGGRLGAVMGEKLAALGRGRTVLVVTHTPQLAAWAAQHQVVRKSQAAQQTQVEVRRVQGQDRVDELAAMLGGGKAAVTQARSLLAKGKR